MKRFNTLASIWTAVAILISAAAAFEAIWENYQLEKTLKEAKAEELIESPAKVTQLRTLGGVVLKETKPQVKKQVVNISEPETVAEVAFKAHEEIPLADEFQEWIETECERLGVEAAYIYALIESESSFRTGILIEDGGGHSAGLCQINSVNWPDMEKRGLDPLDEFDNITYCITLVKGYFDKYPTADHVTTCYKAGEGGAKRLNYHLSVCDTINERTEYFNNILKGGTENGEN